MITSMKLNNLFMKNLILIIATVSLFSCKKEDKVTVNPTDAKTGKFEYTFTAQSENHAHPTNISLNFYTIQRGKNVKTTKTFLNNVGETIAKWDTTISANNVTVNISSPNMRKNATFEGKFNGVTVYNEQVYWDRMPFGLTKDL